MSIAYFDVLMSPGTCCLPLQMLFPGQEGHCCSDYRPLASPQGHPLHRSPPQIRVLRLRCQQQDVSLCSSHFCEWVGRVRMARSVMRPRLVKQALPGLDLQVCYSAVSLCKRDSEQARSMLTRRSFEWRLQKASSLLFKGCCCQPLQHSKLS